MPSKKIFDINPGQRKFEESPAAPTGIKSVKKTDFFSKKKAPLFLSIVLLIGAAAGYFLLPHKIKIEIWPEQKVIKENIIASIAVGRSGENYIPGEIVKEERAISQSFAVTNTKLKSAKARGVIRIYNNYSAASQSLLAATRFVSDDGKLFRITVRVVVPGGHYEGGKLVPGFIDTEVAADQPGEDYNIDASTFSIPGFAGTPKYTAFYAKSFEPMSGGLLKEVPQVSQADLNKAKEILTQKAASEAREIIKNSFSSNGYVVLDEAITSELVDFESGAKAGEESETFTAQANAAVRALVFKKIDLDNFSRNYIKGKILSEEKLIGSSLKTEYSLESINLTKQEIFLNLSISARSYSLPGDNQIKEMVKNKNAKDIEDIIKNIPLIRKARVDFWPFWANLVPDDPESIEVVLHLD